MCGGNATSYKRVEYLTLFFILYDIKFYYKFNIGVASGKCGFHTLRAFSPLIPMVCRLFRYSKVYIVP
jgi:hypothetical protein